MAKEPCLRFVPSAAEGMPDVTEVAVFPDRIEVLSAGRVVRVWFADIARWPEHPAWWWRLRRWLGWRPAWLPVADRDWFHPNEGKYFSFYTEPPLVVFMPADGPSNYKSSHFRRVQDVIAAGGYSTFDLG